MTIIGCGKTSIHNAYLSEAIGKKWWLYECKSHDTNIDGRLSEAINERWGLKGGKAKRK